MKDKDKKSKEHSVEIRGIKEDGHKERQKKGQINSETQKERERKKDR